MKPWERVPAVVGLAGFVALGVGCSIMPEKEPIPDELAILFTASTGAEIEPCG